jgi:hypothetical protein
LNTSRWIPHENLVWRGAWGAVFGLNYATPDGEVSKEGLNVFEISIRNKKLGAKALMRIRRRLVTLCGRSPSSLKRVPPDEKLFHTGLLEGTNTWSMERKEFRVRKHTAKICCFET